MNWLQPLDESRFAYLALSVVLALTISLSAQQSTPVTDPALLMSAEAKQRAQWTDEWLRSEDPRQVAWGAWLARQDRRKTVIPLLLERINAYQPQEHGVVEQDRHDALLAVLDTLIGLGASVPADEVRKLYPEFPAQSLILLVRTRDENAQFAMLEIFREAKANWDWLAAGNLLLKNHTPGFAQLLLSRYTQHVSLYVIDGGVGGGIGGGSSECMTGLGAPKQGWPPVGLYQLTQFPERIPQLEAIFLIGGETAVYYLRTEPGNYHNPTNEPAGCDDGSRDSYRAQYINRLVANSYEGPMLDPYPVFIIQWKSAAAYRQQLLDYLEKRRSDFQSAVLSLSGARTPLLTAEEAAGLEPRIEFVIRDERRNPSVPLPTVFSSNGRVAVVPAFTKPIN